MTTAAAPPGARPGAYDGDLRIQLAGVDATLSCAFAPFMEYAAAHMGPLLAPTAAAPQIRAHLTWHEGAPPRRAEAVRQLAGWNRIDRDLFREGPRLAWFRIDDFPDLHLRFTWDGRELLVEGDYYHRLSKTPRRDWLSRLVYRRNLPTLRRRRFTTLLYYLVYYPAFWWLEHHDVCHPIHAGGVERPDGILVLAGPSGVGKSTLTTGLAADPGARLLSDTFLLHDAAAVRAVPEPLLLDAWSRTWIGPGASALQPMPHRYSLDRDGFQWPADRLSPGGPVRVLAFPQRAAAHAVRRVSPDEAQGRIRAADLIVNDVRRYWAFAAVLELMDPKPLVQRREQRLAELVAAVPAFEVGLTAQLTREEMAALFDRLLRDRA